MKIAVITGGSKGIGRAIAKKFAENSYITYILDLDQENGLKTADELKKYAPSYFIQTDVSNFKSIEAAEAQIISNENKIDVLVINAGISNRKTIAEISVANWDKIIDVNLNGSFYTLKAFYEDLKSNKNSKLIFVTSGSGLTGTGGGAHYAASKSGQHGLMKAASKELGAYGINVNAIAPRVIESDLLDELYPNEKSREELVKKIPIGRFGKPNDIANLAFFLASPESSYVHGQIILADGGRTL
ncbi:SDR family NAD(P)-dependent oxidoreductase [Hutsoniella sourekii]